MTNRLACEDLSNIKDVAAFLAFTFDMIGHHGLGSDLSKEDCRGLSAILSWVRDEIDESTQEIRAQLQTAQTDALREVGLPLEAIADANLRRAWQSGFARGAAQAGAGDQK